jgi:sulfoxide reductase heme-binding subunit YedZ
MIPLALTSTAGWIRRLGGKRWNWLHRLVYLTGIAGVIHYWWLVKVVSTSQIVYAVILATLLGVRLWFAAARSRSALTAPRRVRTTA